MAQEGTDCYQLYACSYFPLKRAFPQTTKHKASVHLTNEKLCSKTYTSAKIHTNEYRAFRRGGVYIHPFLPYLPLPSSLTLLAQLPVHTPLLGRSPVSIQDRGLCHSQAGFCPRGLSMSITVYELSNSEFRQFITVHGQTL
jgi:hypothetical protein